MPTPTPLDNAIHHSTHEDSPVIPNGDAIHPPPAATIVTPAPYIINIDQLASEAIDTYETTHLADDIIIGSLNRKSQTIVKSIRPIVEGMARKSLNPIVSACKSCVPQPDSYVRLCDHCYTTFRNIVEHTVPRVKRACRSLISNRIDTFWNQYVQSTQRLLATLSNLSNENISLRQQLMACSPFEHNLNFEHDAAISSNATIAAAPISSPPSPPLLPVSIQSPTISPIGNLVASQSFDDSHIRSISPFDNDLSFSPNGHDTNGDNSTTPPSYLKRGRPQSPLWIDTAMANGYSGYAKKHKEAPATTAATTHIC